MKTCFKCHQSQPLDRFRADPRMVNGHHNECKTCANRYNAERRAKLRETSLEWVEKKIASDKLSTKRYRESAACKESTATRSKYNAKWRAANKEKAAAHWLVQHAIETGRLLRQPCFCGEKAMAHHEDYSKPLDVVWLCCAHHGERHAQINKERRAAKFAAKQQPGAQLS